MYVDTTTNLLSSLVQVVAVPRTQSGAVPRRRTGVDHGWRQARGTRLFLEDEPIRRHFDSEESSSDELFITHDCVGPMPCRLD